MDDITLRISGVDRIKCTLSCLLVTYIHIYITPSSCIMYRVCVICFGECIVDKAELYHVSFKTVFLFFKIIQILDIMKKNYTACQLHKPDSHAFLQTQNPYIFSLCNLTVGKSY